MFFSLAFLLSTDNVSGPAGLTYRIAQAPAHGSLLLDGVATDSFTQAEIDAGRVQYRQNGDAADSDGFTFTVSDMAGNTIGPEPFAIAIVNTTDPVTVGTDTGACAASGDLPIWKDALCTVALMGNHDYGATGSAEPSRFGEAGARSIELAIDRLSEDDVAWMRTRKPAEVVREMRMLHEERGITIFLFQDDDFPLFGPVWRRWANEFVDELHRNHLPGKVIWKMNCRADVVERELFLKMREAGLYLVYMGLESGSEEGLTWRPSIC